MKNRDSPIVYICSRYSGNIKENTRMAKRYCRYAIDRGCVPIVPHLYLPSVLSEETERELALQLDLKLIEHCDEIWVCGELSDGMVCEMSYAAKHGIPMRRIRKENLRCTKF